jgi:hypothetical protein
MKLPKFTLVVITLCLLLTSCTFSSVDLYEDVQSIPLDNMQFTQISIDMKSGILVLGSGAQGLIDLESKYANSDSRPIIDQKIHNAGSSILVRQPHSFIRSDRNEWNLSLTNDIPISLNLRLGSGIYTLSLGGLHLAGLVIESEGASVILVDLAGFWDEDLNIKINGNIGTALTITTPQGTATQIKLDGHVRKLDPGNLHREKNLLSNSVGASSPLLQINLEGHYANLSVKSGFNRDMPISIALDLARRMFSQNEVFDCSSQPQDRQPRLDDTVRELWFDYLCHLGPEHRVFDGQYVLTKDLAESELVHQIRRQFYAGEPLDQATLYFNIPEFLSATTDMLLMIQSRQRFEFSITHFIGSFDYSVTRQGDRIHFVVHNQTDRASGTHIPLRFPEDGYTYSLEELVREKPQLADTFLLEFIHSGKYPIVSILEAKDRSTTTPGEGGGNFTQTFSWTESDLGVTDLPPWPTYLEQIDLK